MMKNILSETLALGLVLSMSPAVVGSVTAADLSIVLQAPTDETLKERVAYRLETSAIVRTYDVKVKVDAGVATLSGTVATAAQKAEAAKIAKVDGITRVENTIDVDAGVDKTLGERLKGGFSKTGEKISDGWITTKLNWFFVGEDLLKDSKIDVDTKDNVVTLKGTVASQAGRARAVELAKATEGVKSVVDQLVVSTSSQ
jgi:hyperosmotically inducible periplasmic protein